jgi:ribosomal protein S18 acetylase RimI-like enzyme
MSAGRPHPALAARARDWRRACRAAVCDVAEPWAHGTVLRATDCPSYYDYNVVVVEDEPQMSVAELVALADTALAGMAHRLVDFEQAAAAVPLRAGFEALGWRTTRLLWMHHESAPPPGPDIAVQTVAYEAVQALRVDWLRADGFPDYDPDDFHAQVRRVAEARDVQVLAVYEKGEAIAFAHIEHVGDGAEITQVYVDPRYRGDGRGTALTRAAIVAAGDVRDLWICADDEGRPKELYARLGFRPAATTMEFLRMPSA